VGDASAAHEPFLFFLAPARALPSPDLVSACNFCQANEYSRYSTMIIDFGSLYERYAQDVYRFALYLCGDPALAEDITAEAFVRAWVTPGEVRVGTVKAYLFMIARNLFRAGLREAKREAALEPDLADSDPGPEAQADAHLALRAALAALQTLPETDRAALLMHVQDGLPYDEIAAVLGLSVGAVKVKVHRARLKLNRLRREEAER
jgi:RNA polymerase sigma-70 factor (ECF subfamily)